MRYQRTAMFWPYWARIGFEIEYLHFHSQMEIGYCHKGTGVVALGQENIPYKDGAVMIVPPDFLIRLTVPLGQKAIGNGCMWIWNSL